MPLIPIKPFKTPRKVAAAQVSQLANMPPPVGGLNYRDPISDMQPQDAVVLDNLIPRQQGVELRKGWKYITSETVSLPIKSVFGYNAVNSANDKIFAAAGGKIYDVTSGTPTVAVAATGSAQDYWWTTHFSNAGNTWLLAVSPGAGYWTYDNVNGWVNRTAATTGLPNSVRTVAVWKQRVWFTIEGSSDVYYLANVNAIQGAATVMPMGSVLRNGGSISALVNWTIDSGFSIDDFLIAIGTEGDIGIWQGTDPTNANDFGLKGVWYIGPVPRYGVYFTPNGGDIMVLSESGLVAMSRLIGGQYNDAINQQVPSAKIQTVLQPEVVLLRDTPQWSVFTIPQQNILVVKMPQGSGGAYKQYAMNITTGSWCTFSGLPMECTTMMNGELYFGTADGYVCKGLFGNRDEAPYTGSGGDYIDGVVQTAFQHLGTPANNKLFKLARPIFIAPEAPSVKLQINTQYTFNNVPGTPAFNNVNSSNWDAGVWNASVWSGATNTYQAWVGVTGLGYYGSLRMKVRGVPGTIFTSAHIMSEVGGIM